MIAIWLYLAAGLGFDAACILVYLRLPPTERAKVDDGLADLGLTLPTLLAGVAVLWPAVLASLAGKRR